MSVLNIHFLYFIIVVTECEYLVIVEDYFKTVFAFHSACKLTVPMYFLFGLVLEPGTHTVAQVGLNS